MINIKEDILSINRKENSENIVNNIFRVKEVGYPNEIELNKIVQHDETEKINKSKEKEQGLEIISTRQVEVDMNSQLELAWTDICMTATIEEGKMCNKTKVEKNVLTNVSGSLITGSSLAILGASGAGKTTLLNLLSRKIESATLKTTGKVTLNNQELKNEDFSALTSYVMQDDNLEPCMTPREILLFTAQLKINLPMEQIEQRVKHLLKQMRIEKCQNTRIGNNLERGVSGGERKRTSIAVELLSDSPILFLDEPTTGLDSFNAYEVVNTLNELCLENKMVIFTIHQPASEIFELISNICILALGKTVYFGPTKNIYDFFSNTGLAIPNNYNPFEHIIEVTNFSIINEDVVKKALPDISSIEEDKEKYKYLIDHFSNIYEKSYKHIPETKYTELSTNTLELIKEKRADSGFCTQLYLLVLRQLLITLRNKKVLFAKVLQYIIVGVIIALVFNNLSLDEIGIADRRGLLSFMPILVGFVSTSQAILTCKCLI
jgi:ABC-type multidrug transport system ATPase subunit